jgi:hypothetical protein
MKMRRPEDDVALTDGDCYFVSTRDYEAHLSETIETKEVSLFSSVSFPT